MGAKAGILAIGDGDFAEALRQLPAARAERTAELIAGIYPGYQIEPVEGWPLDESTYPDRDIVYALSAPGIGIVCDQRFSMAKPSQLPAHVLELAAGRRQALCAVHSVDDSFAYAVWNDGELVRSLSVSLGRGIIIEDIGRPLEFERLFWANRGAPGNRRRHALRFHPLDMAEQAMRFLFGFTLEEAPEPGDIDAGQISMLGYRVVDPTGVEQAEREAALREFLQHHRRQSYQIGPDGSRVEI